MTPREWRREAGSQSRWAPVWPGCRRQPRAKCPGRDASQGRVTGRPQSQQRRATPRPPAAHPPPHASLAGPRSGSAAGSSPGPLPLTADAGRRPVYTWLAELERLRDAAAAGTRPKVSLLDIADRQMELSPAQCQPTSPRSVEACLRCAACAGAGRQQAIAGGTASLPLGCMQLSLPATLSTTGWALTPPRWRTARWSSSCARCGSWAAGACRHRHASCPPAPPNPGLRPPTHARPHTLHPPPFRSGAALSWRSWPTTTRRGCAASA